MCISGTVDIVDMDDLFGLHFFFHHDRLGAITGREGPEGWVATNHPNDRKTLYMSTHFSPYKSNKLLEKQTLL